MKESNIEILGVDHGYKNMKTAHCLFPTCISQIKEIPGSPDGILEFENKIYTIHGKKVSSVDTHDKSSSDEFYLLTLAAIAKELQYRKKSRATIRLAVGLPFKWYDTQKKDFKNSLLRRKELHFKFEGTSYNVKIEECTVYSQGFAAIAPALVNYKDKYIVLVDIGGETVDIIPVQNGRILYNECKIDTRATIWLINDIMEKIETEFFAPVHESFVMDMMLHHTLSDKPKSDYEKLVIRELSEYSGMIMSRLKEFKINTDMTPIIFMGGGSHVIKNYSTLSGNVSYNLDISANAKGYEYIDTIIARRG